MLEKRFRLFHGVGDKTERRLWSSGIETWDHVLEESNPGWVRGKIWDSLNEEIPKLQAAIDEDDITTLNNYLDSKTDWCAIPNFLGRIAFLDIETTGLSPDLDQITTIAVYDGQNVHNFVKGENLSEFPAYIQNFPAIATYYGKCFDVPFIEYHFNIEIRALHFDLCFLLRRLKLTGGLKKVERKVGLSRGNLASLDGYKAVIMWYRYKRTENPKYLETLLAYNNEDAINLEYLLHYAYNHLIDAKDIPIPKIEYPKKPVDRPYKANAKVVQEMRRRLTI